MVNTADITVSNGVITVTDNAKNSTKKLSELADLVVGETYILSANTTVTENFIYLYGNGANISWVFGDAKTITQEFLDALVFFYGGASTAAQITNFMIRLATETDATFAPYSNICPISGHTGLKIFHSGANMSNPETLSISWQSEAGTVYGGTLAIDEDGSCKLTATHAIVDLDTLTWQNASSSSFERCYSSGVASVIKRPATNNEAMVAWAEQFKVVSRNLVTTESAGISCEYNTGYLFVQGTIAPQGKLVYPLATPITYTLPDVTMLETITGTNNIWTNTGDITVTYDAYYSTRMGSFRPLPYNTTSLKQFNEAFIIPKYPN